MWYKVAGLNMSDPSQRCPSEWREYNNHTLHIRACRRPQSTSANCVGTFYVAGQQYSKVCGRAIGYQIRSTDAFWHQVVAQSINSYYVNGISITHMENLVITFGLMLQNSLKVSLLFKVLTAPAVIQLHLTITIHKHL